MFEINKEIITQCSKSFFSCIEELLLFNIVFRFNPLSLEHSPNSFSNIQMWRVRWQIEQEESSLLPKWNTFLNALCSMHAGIIQYKKCLFSYFEGEVFQKFHHFLCIHIFLCSKLKTFTFPVYHSETVHSCRPFGKNTNLLTRKLPTIRNIPFCAYMGFVSIKQFYLMSIRKSFQFKEFLKLSFINSFGRFSFGALSYTFISSAKLFKKR